MIIHTHKEWGERKLAKSSITKIAVLELTAYAGTKFFDKDG